MKYEYDQLFNAEHKEYPNLVESFVVHWTVPTSVSGYYQESGRAGRDNKPAKCRIYFSNEEFHSISYILREANKYGSGTIKQNRENENVKHFEQMVFYCMGTKCRHSVFSTHFGNEPLNCKRQCDCCRNEEEVQNRILAFKNCDTSTQRQRQRQITSSASDGFAFSRHYTQQAGTDIRSTSDAMNSQGNGESRKLWEQRLALHRGSQANSVVLNIPSKSALSKSNVQSAEVTHTQVRGLSIEMRELFYSLLTKELMKNYQMFKNHTALASLTEHDINSIAKSIEYSVFNGTTTAVAYKCNGWKLILSLTRSNRKLVLDANLENHVLIESNPSSRRMSSEQKGENDEISNVMVLAKDIHENSAQIDIHKEMLQDATDDTPDISDFMLDTAKLQMVNVEVENEEFVELGMKEEPKDMCDEIPEAFCENILAISKSPKEIARVENSDRKSRCELMQMTPGGETEKTKPSISNARSTKRKNQLIFLSSIYKFVNKRMILGSRVADGINNADNISQYAIPLGTSVSNQISREFNKIVTNVSETKSKLREAREIPEKISIGKKKQTGPQISKSHSSTLNINQFARSSSTRKKSSSADNSYSSDKGRPTYYMRNWKVILPMIKSELNPYYKTKYIPDRKMFRKITKAVYQGLEEYHAYGRSTVSCHCNGTRSSIFRSYE